MAGFRRKPGTEEITWRGRRYRRFPDHSDRHRRVYYMATTAPRSYLHQDIYESVHGPVPEGWHVHHVNHDPLDNRIENLVSMSPSAHSELHVREHAGAVRNCDECGTAYESFMPWSQFCSNACKMRRSRREGRAYVRPPVGKLHARRCNRCACDFIAKREWAKFCSTKCRNAFNRDARKAESRHPL